MCILLNFIDIKIIVRKIGKWLGYLLLFLLLISILLSIPFVQTKLGTYVTQRIKDNYDVNLTIKKVDFSFLGSVNLKDIEIRDHHKDTLIFVKKLGTSLLNAKKVLDSEVNLGSLSLDGVHFYMKTYKDEKDDNLAIFIDSFDDEKEKDSLTSPFVLNSSNVYVYNLNYKLLDKNKKDSLQFSAKNVGGNLQDLSIVGPDFSAKIRGLYFRDNSGLEVTNLTTDFSYSRTEMHFDKARLQTQNSDVSANIKFSYKREDLSDFNDKVNIKAAFNKSSLAILDLKKYYKELSSRDIINFSGNFNGKLNNFDLKKLRLSSRNGIKINGNFSFVNAVNSERGFIFEGDINNVTATYKKLKYVLPNILGKTLPTEFDKLGTFNLSGIVKFTPDQMNATLEVASEIGGMVSDLQLTNLDNIDFAEYNGEMALKEFDIGVFFNDPLFGKISLKGDVKGSGFKLENISTSFIGEISEMNFKEYPYRNLLVNGEYQNNKFDGDLIIDDQNFKMKFNGLADLSSKIHQFDFKSEIEYLNLKETNLFTRDSISEVKGKIALDIQGNTFDDIIGNATFKNFLYTNEKEEYVFEEFNVASSIKDSIKTIEVTSKDIANGSLSGKFSFSELLPVAQNALGSIYTNYKPYEVAQNQFLDFNFTIYNQIISVFFPDISIDDNTKIKGKINADEELFKVTISSPKITVYENEIKDILLRTDNQNILYNTHLTASEVNTKYYKVSKLNLLNRTENDTLFFKSVFKGGTKKNENFNLDFFYTFNPEAKSVIGFQKSAFQFKGNTWNIDPNKTNTDKITFDLNTNEFIFSPFEFVSDEQKIEFKGSLKGSEEKALFADFTKVKLQSILPVIDSLKLRGTLSGNLEFVQNKGIYSPEALLIINDFEANNFRQGDLSLSVKGDNSYEKYDVDLSIKNQKVKSIAATGSLDFSTKRPMIDLEVYLEEFGLDAFSPLGKDVLSSIRGSASGDFTLKGFLGNPDMEGILRLKNAGLKFPYLNIDYDFTGESIITLQQQSFILDAIKLRDSKYKSQGKLQGSITHSNFDQWFLDMEIESDNLLVLDTQNNEEALYYGTAFINGTIDITGLTDRLTIYANAKTQPNTIFVVPLKDVETVDSYRLIHFKSKETETINRQYEIAEEALKGLSLDIDLEVTKDAIAQVVIDEVSGSQLKGTGAGNLRIEINTRGKFNMFGDYRINNGVYDFKYGGFINKPFIIQKGGTVSWSGSPYEANLDVTAVYKASANPAVLLNNFSSNRNIDIDLVTRITGGLFSSKQELDVQLPNVDPNIASELEFILNDNNINQKTTQFISLLALGTFTNPDKVDFDANTTLTNTASNAISAAFSNLLNSPDSKFKLGVGYQQGIDNSIDRLNTDNQLDVSVSTQLSDKIIINGKVGVPVGANTQTSVIGEVKIEVLLNDEGTLRGTIFNRQNEIQFSAEEEGYTQGVGLSYQVNFNNLSGLIKKIGLKKREKKKAVLIKKDSIQKTKKKLINFKGN